MRQLIGNEHAVFFRDEDELVRKAIELHHNDELLQSIATAGPSHYCKYFSAQRVTQYMLKKLTG